MGYLTNTWIRYVDRSYQQIKERVLTDQQFRVPEITDHTESNILVKMLSIWAGIAEMIGYYSDNEGREAFLGGARLYRSGIAHARSSDYRVRGKLAANGDVVFSLDDPLATDLLIPIGTQVTASSGTAIYSTTESVTIPAGELSISVGVRQFTTPVEVTLGNSTGLVGQEVIIGQDVTDSTTELTVGGEIWTRVETLAFSLPEDKHYQETVSKNYDQVLLFGDGINGMIPPAGAEFVVVYKPTLGEDGNAQANTIDTVLSPFDEPLNVNNPTSIVGGSDVETLEQLQARIPKSVRTKDRAVTAQDHIDIAELAAGVAKAGYDFNCGKTIDIYIVPDGGGLASSVLIDATQEWFRLRKMVATNIVVKPAGEIRTKLRIYINALPQFRNADVDATVRTNLKEFISYKNQDVKGELQLGDLYQVVENSAGVKNSRIETMTTLPYARPLNDNEQQLDWVRTVKPASLGTIGWRITFVSPNSYQLLKNNGYIGEFTVGQLVDLTEISFQVNSEYAQGDTWEFYSYPYYGTIILQEPSIPVVYDEDITLIITGGLL